MWILLQVNMIGINSDRDSLGDSIAHLLARHCKEVIYDRRIFDAVTQKIYPVVRIVYFRAVLYFLLKLIKAHCFLWCHKCLYLYELKRTFIKSFIGEKFHGERKGKRRTLMVDVIRFDRRFFTLCDNFCFHFVFVFINRFEIVHFSVVFFLIGRFSVNCGR